jgi:hypothetical protein
LTGLSLENVAAIAGFYELDDPERHESWLDRMLLDRSAMELLCDVDIPVEQGTVDVHGLTSRSVRGKWAEREVVFTETSSSLVATARAEAAAVGSGEVSVVGKRSAYWRECQLP